MPESEGPYRLDLTRPNRVWGDGGYGLTEEIEAWAMSNLHAGWTVKTGTRNPTSDEMGNLIPEFTDMNIREYWIEFEDYRDWLLFKLRWCDQ